ncbi:hypothetical protein SS50377_20781 [Spironucleus salmonicida]|uniref:Cyclin n=1 Tax=Spironucleus salmonicida TaxID=348837 RepID=A0A9P8LZR7_9EUKA|nr:hypothetical protein SS50377_20781 [Spironucleus salmonicida]
MKVKQLITNLSYLLGNQLEIASGQMLNLLTTLLTDYDIFPELLLRAYFLLQNVKIQNIDTFITLVFIQAKLEDDLYVNLKHYIYIINIAELEKLEIEICQQLDWKVIILQDQFWDLYKVFKLKCTVQS